MNATRQPASEQIISAFMDLMSEKPFIDITVTDVVKKAGVARASFYRNFSSTSDILDTVLNRAVSEFKENALPVLGSQDERQWRAFLFRYIYFANDRHHKLVLSKTYNISLLLYRAGDVIHELSLSFPSADTMQKYRISSRMGVINNVILHWIDSGKKETPEELVDYLMGFILAI